MHKKINVRSFFEKHMDAVCIISFLVFVLSAGVFYKITYYFNDVRMYNIPWLKYFDTHHLWEMYDESLPGKADYASKYINYPPLFPAWLWMIRVLFEKAVSRGYTMLSFALIKSMGLISHGFILHYCLKKKKRQEIFFWACNPAWFIITALWGQLDELFCFILVRFIESMQENKGLCAGLLFTFLCLVKVQGVIMVIPYAVWLLTGKDKSRLKGVLAGLVLGYIIWLPFSIHMKDPLFPVREYWFFGTDFMGSTIPSPGTGWLMFMLNFSDTRLMRTEQYFVWTFVIIIFVLDYVKRRDMWESVAGFWICLFPFSLGMLERYLTYPAACSVMNGHIRRSRLLIFIITIIDIDFVFNGICWESSSAFWKEIAVNVCFILYLALAAVLIFFAFSWIYRRFGSRSSERAES